MTITAADVDRALSHACGLCKQPAKTACINPCTGKPLPDRTVHFYRIKP